MRLSRPQLPADFQGSRSVVIVMEGAVEGFTAAASRMSKREAARMTSGGAGDFLLRRFFGASALVLVLVSVSGPTTFSLAIAG